MRDLARTVLLVLVVAAVPAVSAGQGLGAIAGVARDASGAVLPGVTVEVASPALIEKIRTAVTDGSGQYRILSLPNGIYSVTFTLPGFGTVKRDGIEVLANFTATANADLTVGAVTETVTVTGESPVVDVQSAATIRALTDQNFKEIPSGGTWTNLAGLIPAVNVSSVPDVGGTSGDPVAATLTAHGSTAADQNQMIDGIKIGNVLVGGARTNLSVSPLLFDEVNVTFAGQSAEFTTNGVQSNAIPKSGGNVFHGTALVNGSTNDFQSDNLTPRLRAMGLTSSNTFKSLYDVNGALGGPILTDRLWFYGTARHNVNKANIAGLYYPVDANAIQRQDDRSETAYSDIYFRDFTGRVTAALGSKQKVTFFGEYQPKCDCTYQISGTKAPEASAITKWPIVLIQGSYTNVVTNRILIEAGVGYSDASYTIYPQLGLPQASPNDPFTILPNGMISSTNRPISIVEQGGGALALPPLTYRSGGNGATSNSQDDTLKQVASRATVSYTTGAHSFKVGMDDIYGYIIRRALNYNGFIQYRTRDYVPNQLTLYAPSAGIRSNGNGLGLFVQDRWTMNRMTINAGLRFDFMNEWNDPWSTSTSPSPWLPNRPVVNFGKIENVPNWSDINPRLGFSYDLFGNGKTAIKASANRAVSQDVINMATNNNPGQTIATNTARNWTDNDRDFVPDCDLTNPLAQGPTLAGALNAVDTCGQNLNANFGSAVPATTYDPSILNGWGVRPYNWEFSAGVQQEILPRLSASVSYFRRIQGNFTVTDNVLTTASDYRQYSIVVPTDPRLPNSGETMRGLFDITPALVSANRNMVTFAKNFGNQYAHYDGVDVTLDARLRQLVLQGGVTVGQTMTDNCDLADNIPEMFLGVPGVGPTAAGVWTPLEYCRQVSGWVPQYKALGSYQLPWWGIRTSGTIQSIPGPMVQANVIYTGAQIVALNPHLGAFSAGAVGQASVGVFEPGNRYGDRLNQVDLRFTKIVRMGRSSLDLNLDLYNALNSDAIITQTSQYGTTWLRPTSIIQARFLKFSARYDF
jgi:hypothetical protein